jgi:hypothetical protein
MEALPWVALVMVAGLVAAAAFMLLFASVAALTAGINVAGRAALALLLTPLPTRWRVWLEARGGL